MHFSAKCHGMVVARSGDAPYIARVKGWMMKQFVVAALGIGLATSAFAPFARAVEPVARFKDWSVFIAESNGEKICFASSVPKTAAPRNVDHGEVNFIVATWAAGGPKAQPNLTVGYPLRNAPPPAASVGSRKFPMYVDGREAFIDRSEDERSLVGELRRGASLRVDAASSRGTRTSYTFSLAGSAAAFDHAAKLCQ